MWSDVLLDLDAARKPRGRRLASFRIGADRYAVLSGFRIDTCLADALLRRKRGASIVLVGYSIGLLPLFPIGTLSVPARCGRCFSGRNASSCLQVNREVSRLSVDGGFFTTNAVDTAKEGQMFKVGLVAATVIAMLSSVVLAAEPAPESPAQKLAHLLDDGRAPLTVADSGVSGAGAAKLIEAARRAEFILVGEDHGFAEVPQFVVALQRSLGKDAPPNLVLEVGPLSAARLAAAARDDTMSELAARYPGVIPFFDWAGDGAMAKAWQKNEARTALWGIDQEFLLSTGMHLERLNALETRKSAREAIAPYLLRAQAADAKLAAEHDPSVALLLHLQAADFAKLRDAIKPVRGSESASILDELERSAQIYRTQESDGYGSNRQRSLLMKQHFMTYYDAAAAQQQGQSPRAMFRLGAFHAGRGLSATSQFDIGNLASELAASHGMQSLHVLVIAAGGTVNQWLPFMADTKLRTAPYDAKAELAVLQVESFLEHALPDSWTIFDVDALRRSRPAREAGGAKFERLVFGYDYVIVIPQAHAAIEYRAR